MNIDKIVATGIRSQNPYNSENFNISEDHEVVLFDKSKKVLQWPLYNEDPINLLIALCRDTNILISDRFKVYNSGYGCIDIKFGRYQYTVQFGDGVVQLESLRENGSIVASSMSGSNLYIKDSGKVLYNTVIPNYYNKLDVTEYLFILNFTEYGETIKNELRKFIILDQYSYTNPYKIYTYINSSEVFKTVETYNAYLEKTGWNRKILYNESQHIFHPIPGESKFMILNIEDNKQYPISSEGSGFKRFLHIIEEVDRAKQFDVPLIIENFGEGVDEDKCEVLFDMIIKESGINIVLSS